MKIGYIAFGKEAYWDGTNRIFGPGEDTRYEICVYQGSISACMFPQLYPDDLYATIVTSAPDLDICSQLDAVVYVATPRQDRNFVHFIDQILCPVVTWHDTGYRCIAESLQEDVLLCKRIMDASALIVTSNQQSISFYESWTDTPVLYTPLPYPVDRVIKAAGLPSNAPSFDVLVAYCPSNTRRTYRNGYIAALAGQRVIDTIDGFNSMGIFAHTSDPAILAKDRQFLSDIGCKDFVLIKLIPLDDAIQIISKAQFAIDLDMNEACGKFAIDCALTKTPVAVSDRLPHAVRLFGDIRIQKPFDVDAVLATANMVSEGRWYDSWLELSYQRALQFDVKKVAITLEKAIMEAVK